MRDIRRVSKARQGRAKIAVVAFDATGLLRLLPFVVAGSKRFEQRFFAVEIDVQGSLGYAGDAGDLVHAGRIEAARSGKR